MKVERKTEEKFEPIVITLETKEEADFVWHLFNSAPAKSLIQSWEERGLNFPMAFGGTLWRDLNEVYNPRRGK